MKPRLRPGFLLLALLAARFAAAGELLPNVILISVDTLRADHLSCYGYSRSTTPNLDRLAESGVRFLDATTSIPLTNPALSTLLTSRHPSQTGATRNGLSLPPQNQTLAQILQRHGYFTAAVVSSWPLHDSRSGLAPGFDLYQDRLMRKFYLGLKVERDARWVTHQARQVLANLVSEPFFLWVHYADPHRPHLAQAEFSFNHPQSENGKRARVEDRYDSEIAHTDRWIGSLLDDLKARGLLDRSLVILLADHGESLGDRHFFGHGRRLYQSILRIPLILAGPTLPAGKAVAAPVQMLDVAPTIMAYLDLPPGPEMEGRDLIALVREDRAPKPVPMFFETYGVAVPVPGLQKLQGRSGPVAVGLRLGPLKITYSFRKHTWEFYNLDQDPLEQNNLFDPADPEFRLLAEQLRQWYQARNLKGPVLPGF